jgi:DNA-binding transcriptional LysR family regulator
MASPAPPRRIEWSDLEVVLAICRTGSLSGAARLLGNNHSTVFRKINAIETRLGVRLFERLPTGYAMTEAGEATMHYAERMENEVRAFETDLFGRDLQLHGKVRIGMGEGLAKLVFPPLLAEFQRINPGVTVDVVSSVDNSDLSRREVDIAIRATKQPPPSSVGRYIGDFEFAVYAAPSYLDRAGERDLKDHDWALPYVVMDWLVPMIWKNREEGYKRCAFTSNSVLATIEAAASGMGVSLIAAAFAEGDERLVRITEPIEHLTMQLWILMHPDLRRNARITALTRFLAETLAPQKSMFLAGRAVASS